MNFARFLAAAAAASILLLLFLVAVREGRLASPRARLAALIGIAVACVFLWLRLGPGFGT